MLISNRDIQNTISCIVRFFNDSVVDSPNREYFEREKLKYWHQLQGLSLLFQDSKNSDFIESAKSQINDTVFQSGDLCRSPVQSPDAVGQGSTEYDFFPCRDLAN